MDHRGWVGGALALASVAVQAQMASKPDLEFRREQDREQAQRQLLQTQPKVHLLQEQATEDRLPQEDAPCFRIERVVFARDAQEFPWLAQSLAGPGGDDSPLGRCLGARGVALLEKRTQSALINAGYVTSRVLVDSQDLSTGELRLTVLAGRIQGISLVEDENSRSVNWRTALPVRPGDLLNVRDIEQALENFKRSPTSEADIRIVPAPDGAPPGYSDLLISYRQRTPFRWTFSVDDSGTSTTGRFQGSVTLSVDNPLALNDLFYVSHSQSLDAFNSGPRGNHGNGLYYAVPWGDWLLTADGNSYQYHQGVAGATRTYLYNGTSNNAGLKLSRVMHRDVNSKVEAGVRVFTRRSRNFIDETEVTVQQRVVSGWEGSLNGRRNWGATTLDGNVLYRQGTGAFGSKAAPEEAYGEGTSRMRLFMTDATLNVPFTAGERSWRYSANWRWQNNLTPLVPQDRFSLGGRYTVRGFDGESILLAGRGWLVRNELGLNLPSVGAQAYLGLDHGEVGGQGSDWLVGTKLTGMVLGLRGDPHDGKFHYDLFVGAPLYKPAQFQTADWVSGFSLNWSM